MTFSLTVDSLIVTIFGVISAIGGLFAFLVGAIPGIISVILGLKLREAKKYADHLLMIGLAILFGIFAGAATMNMMKPNTF
ncbi:MAG: hypothetical protein ACOY3H_01085 [Bacillota bacterium]